MSNSTEQSSLNSTVYKTLLLSLVLLSAVFIGLDCFINSAFYLSQMTWLAPFATFIVLAALSGFVLNFILYALDAPNELNALFDAISKAIAGKMAASEITMLSVFSYAVALGSGLMMGLFTYDTYVQFQLPVGLFSHPIVIVMCLAYTFLTFTLIRNVFADAESDWETFINNIWQGNGFNRQFLLFSVLTVTGLFATLYTGWAWFAGAQHALLLMGFGWYAAQSLASLFFVAVLLGESFFVLKSCMWMTIECDKDQNVTTNVLLLGVLMMLVLLNALGNAAIACSGVNGTMALLAGAFGALLSCVVMTKSLYESSDTELDGKVRPFSFVGFRAKCAEVLENVGMTNDTVLRATGITVLTLAMLVLSQFQAWQILPSLLTVPYILPLIQVALLLGIVMTLFVGYDRNVQQVDGDPSGESKVSSNDLAGKRSEKTGWLGWLWSYLYSNNEGYDGVDVKEPIV